MQRLLLLVPTTTWRARAFVRAAERLPGVSVTFGSEQANTFADVYPVNLITVDLANSSDCTQSIVDFSQRYPVDAVVAVDDQATIAAACASAALGLAHNSIKAVRRTRNKHAMRKALAAADVSQPSYQLIGLDTDPRRLALTLAYPCVLKPLGMSGSRGVLRADDGEAFINAFARVRKIVETGNLEMDSQTESHLLVEQYVPGWEVAIEGILTDGQLQVFAIFDKPEALEGPTFAESIYVTPSSLPAVVQQRIVALTQAAVRAMGLTHGPIHAEVRGCDDTLWFIELAARSIGGRCSQVLRFQGGLALEEVILRHALGEDVTKIERETQAAGVCMLHVPTAGVVEHIRGEASACKIRYVDQVLITAHRGQQVEPLPEGSSYVGFIFARSATASETEKALRNAREALEFVICAGDEQANLSVYRQSIVAPDP